MRTTIRIDDELLKEAKTIAVASGQTLAEVVDEALRDSFARRRQAAKKPYLHLRSFKGDGVQPGVDLYDSAGLLDIMDRADAAS